jgi:hypothetical protein
LAKKKTQKREISSQIEPTNPMNLSATIKLGVQLLHTCPLRLNSQPLKVLTEDLEADIIGEYDVRTWSDVMC